MDDSDIYLAGRQVPNEAYEEVKFEKIKQTPYKQKIKQFKRTLCHTQSAKARAKKKGINVGIGGRRNKYAGK